MHRTAALILFGAVLLLPQRQTPPRVEPAEPAIRVSADLIQVDAVVTDSKGRSVSGLAPEDFEILEDGKRQPTARFSYITPERRTIVLMFDDCDSPGLVGSSGIIQDCLRHFVGQWMRPGDLVSILPVSVGTGDWQQLTGDGQRLYEAIGRVRPGARVPIAAGEPNETTRERAIMERRRPPATDVEGHPLFHGLALFNAVSSAVDGLAEIPGRKFVLVASQFYGWVQFTEKSPVIMQLADRANRAGVVIQVLHGGSNSPLLPGSPSMRVESLRERGPDYLARATGGLSLDNPDVPLTGDGMLSVKRLEQILPVFLMKGLDEVAAEMGGYHLIGYKPARLESGKDGSKFHSIKINVRRSGLKVRSRNGYYGQPEQPVPAAPRTREELLQAALRSPFRGSAMRVRMTPFYSATGKDPKTGRRPTIRAMLAVDARDLRFEEQVDGTKKATVDALAAVYGMETQPVATNSTSCSISAPAGGPGDLATSSLLCGLDMTLDRPGPYVVRVAAMDRASEKIGSAYALAAVPNFDGDGLTLSTPVLTPLLREQVEARLRYERVESEITFEAASGSVTADSSVPERAAPPRLALAGGNPVERVFAPGASIAYSFEIFGTALDSGAGKPALNFLLTVSGRPKRGPSKDLRNFFHFESPLMPIRIDRAVSPTPVTGRIRLPADIEPGWYGMTLNVHNPADRLKPHGYEAMDFTVAKPDPVDAVR